MKSRHIWFSGLILVAALLAAGADLANAIPLSTGLEGYWRFEGSGADASGHARHLTLVGGPGFAPGIQGSAMDLDGTSTQYAVRPVSDAVFDFLSPAVPEFTLQAWVQYDNTTREQVLIEKFTGAGGPGWTLTTRFDQNDIQFYPSMTVPGTTSGGAWHQFLVVGTGGVISLYVDSALRGTGGKPDSVSTNPLLVGRRNAGDARNFGTDGRIDEVAIWSRALTTEERDFLWNAGAGNPIPGAVPEPATLLLLGTGLGGLALRSRFSRDSGPAALWRRGLPGDGRSGPNSPQAMKRSSMLGGERGHSLPTTRGG
jgi:hypothetical protein